MRAYIDMVSSAPPARKGEYETAPMRIALAVEDGETIVRTLARIIALPEHAQIDASWLAKYGVRIEDRVHEVSASVVAAEVSGALEGVSEAYAHFASFHERHFGKLFAGARADVPKLVWGCTMNGTTNMCQIPSRDPGRFKAPSLREAVEQLMAEPFAVGNAPDWRSAAMMTLTGVRQLQWAMKSRGRAAPIVAVVS